MRQPFDFQESAEAMAAFLPAITFISDDEVLEQIVDVSTGGTKRVAAQRRQFSEVAANCLFTEEGEESDAKEQREPAKSDVLHSAITQHYSGGSVHGADLFKLGVQRRRKSSLYTPSKPTAAQSTAAKRKRSHQAADGDSEGGSESSSSEDADDGSDGNSSDASEQQIVVAKKRSKPTKKLLQLSGHEEYFHLQGDTAVGTSDATLAHLKQPMLDLQAVRNGLSNVPDGHKPHRQNLHVKYSSLFPVWMLYMEHGFNILLHGLGSKRRLLEDFRLQHFDDELHLVINGYFPGLQFKDVLCQLTDELGCSTTFRTPADRCQFICDHYSKGNDALYIVVHSIDGIALRSDKIQGYLSALAGCQHIYMVASSDHINVPTIWDGSLLAQFNWLWQEVHTLDVYTEETSYENSIMVHQTGKLVYTALVHVMESLTRNGRGIFKLLAKAELQRDSNDAGQGMAFQDLYSHCKEAFLVSSDQALRAQLTEFLDHKLLKQKKGRDGVEYLSLAVEKQIVERYLSTLDDA